MARSAPNRANVVAIAAPMPCAAPVTTARVVHQHVDGVECTDPLPHRIAVTHVEQLRVRVAAEGDDRFSGAGETVGITVANGDVGAEAGQRDRDLRTDALRGARDDCAPAGQQYGVRRDRHRERRLASPP